MFPEVVLLQPLFTPYHPPTKVARDPQELPHFVEGYEVFHEGVQRLETTPTKEAGHPIPVFLRVGKEFPPLIEV